jgi:hypothetical protein
MLVDPNVFEISFGETLMTSDATTRDASSGGNDWISIVIMSQACAMQPEYSSEGQCQFGVSKFAEDLSCNCTSDIAFDFANCKVEHRSFIADRSMGRQHHRGPRLAPLGSVGATFAEVSDVMSPFFSVVGPALSMLVSASPDCRPMPANRGVTKQQKISTAVK